MKRIAVLLSVLGIAACVAVIAGCASSSGTGSSAGAGPAVSVENRMPFPQRVTYASPLMKPSVKTQEEMEETLLVLFREILRSDMIVDANGPSTRDDFRLVIRHSQAWEVGEGYVDVSHVNVSESQGYGMMMMAYMAGSEAKLNFSAQDWIYGCSNLKEYYDAMLRTVLEYPSIIAPHLFTWELGGYPKDGDNTDGWKEVDGVKVAPFTMMEGGDSATDGDMDIIYSLILADKQWGSDGKYNYKQIALDMLGDLWTYCVHDEYHTLLLGDWAKGSEDENLRHATRPSDFIVSHLKVYAAFDPSHDWQAVVDATYNVIKEIRDIQIAAGNNNGLMPDFVKRGANGWEIPDGTLLEAEDGAFAYNSCRVPWRLGTDYLVYGNSTIGDSSLYDYIIKPLDDFGRSYTQGDLGMFGPMWLDATAFDYTDPDLFAMPFLLPAEAVGADQEWVNTFWAYEPGHEWDFKGMSAYNGDTFADYIKLFVLITASGNYWLP